MYNGHGDVTNLLDGKGGIIGSYYYDAFGNVQENTSTFSNPYRYAGYQYDEEIGKYYLLNRMYDPESARFMQEDTYRGNANDPLSLNLYTYVNNNPMIYDDQNGHWPSFVDNFVSGVKSVVSNVVSSVKEAVSYVGSKISSAVSSGVSYLANTSVGKAVTSTISKGKQIYNTVTSVNKATSIVYNKVIKPQVERDTQQKVEALKKGISVVSSVGSIIKDLVIPKVEFKANNISNSIDYVRGLDLNKLLYGDMPVVAETNVKYDYSPRTGGTLGDKAFNFWTSTPAFKGLDWLSEFQENNPEAMNVANAFMFYKGLKNPLAAEEKVQRSEREIEKSLKSAIKGAGNPERQLLSGSEWNNYFKEAYGAENVTWEGTETLYRTMSKSDYEALAKTGNLRYTRETFTSTSQAYAAQYDGVLVEFKLKQGTMNSLEGIGARETNNPFLRNLYPDMPEIKNVSNWRANNAYFKREGGVLNIGLGQKGKALDTFNNNIIHFEVKK
jgi:RHS repeat-associated protein